MSNSKAEFTLEVAFNAIKSRKDYTQDKALYEEWGVPKTTYNTWLRRNRLPIEHGMSIAVRENISLDWLYLGRNDMTGHIAVNPKTDEIARLVACLDDIQKESLLRYVQSLANATPFAPPVSACAKEVKLVLIDYLAKYLRKNCGAYKIAAEALNRSVGVVHWIYEREEARFTIEELMCLAEAIAEKDGKKVTICIE